MKTLGYAAQNPQDPLAPFTFERRSLRDNDVAMDVLYCGVCHSDLHQARNDWGFSRYPMVPGHEIVGRVSAVGSRSPATGSATPWRWAAWWIPVRCAISAARARNSCAAKATPKPTTTVTA